MTILQTHLSIEPTLSGKLTELSNDYAKALLHTTRQMAADA